MSVSDLGGLSQREWNVNDLLQIVLEWSATGDADIIPSGHSHVIACRAQLPETDNLACHYTVTADRMKAKEGTVTIRHMNGQPMVEIL